MKSKILPLALLLTLSLTRMSFAEKPSMLPEEPKSAWGIKSGESYPGWAVLEILGAAEAELEEAVNEAFEEGYKAGALRYAPEAEYWKSLADTARGDSGGTGEKILFGLGGFFLGVVGMGIYSFAR